MNDGIRNVPRRTLEFVVQSIYSYHHATLHARLHSPQGRFPPLNMIRDTYLSIARHAQIVRYQLCPFVINARPPRIGKNLDECASGIRTSTGGITHDRRHP